MSLRDKTAIVGIGMTDYTKQSGRTVEALAVEAAKAAIADAGLKTADIDCLVTYGLGHTIATNVLATDLGLARVRHYADYNAGGNMAAGVVTHAAMAVASGMADCVLVYRALNGASGVRYGGEAFAEMLSRTSVHSDAEGQFLAPLGITMPAQEFALMCRRHMIRYGTTNEQLGAVATTCRDHAMHNSQAQMHGRPMSLDDYLNAAWIAEPFRIYDCCLMTDGACALIVTSAERARDLARRPAYVMAGVTGAGPANRGLMWGNYWEDHGHCYAAYIKDDLYSMAGVGPEDIDLAQLYDCFSYSVIAQLEDYGFCDKGEGGPFVEAGGMALDGELPVNTGGGLLSEGYIHGLNGVIELVTQLRGEGGGRQVAGAEVGMATAGGASPNGGAVILRN